MIMLDVHVLDQYDACSRLQIQSQSMWWDWDVRSVDLVEMGTSTSYNATSLSSTHESSLMLMNISPGNLTTISKFCWCSYAVIGGRHNGTKSTEILWILIV
jgi:hypothetical protein